MIPELNETEKSILVELTDFNCSIQQIVIDIHFDEDSLTVVEKFDKAYSAIIQLFHLGLIALLKNKYSKTVKNELELVHSESLSEEQVREYLSHPFNWMSEHGTEDDSIYYEIELTRKGELVLDALFEINGKT